MSEGVLETDGDERIVYVNQSALRMLGSSEHTLIGAKLWDIFGPTDRNEGARITERLRTDPKGKSQKLPLTLKGQLLTASFTPVWEHDVCTGLLVLLENFGNRKGPQAP